MKEFKKMKTALIGCGMISKSYLENCCKKFNVLDVTGCSDIIPERSAARAAEFGIIFDLDSGIGAEQVCEAVPEVCVFPSDAIEYHAFYDRIAECTDGIYHKIHL
jgi:predicted dehydrogenase